MHGLATIKRMNAIPQADVTSRCKANAKEWMRRALVALDTGDYAQFRNLTSQAGREVEHLIPISAR